VCSYLWGVVEHLRPVLAAMVEYCEHPIVMPMSNPTSKAECTPEQAYEWTGGKAVVATGSPFAAVTLADGSVRVPGQGNNVYIFPGVGLGAVLCANIIADVDVRITQDDMRSAAKLCASMAPDSMLDVGCLYPPLTDLRAVTVGVPSSALVCRPCGSSFAIFRAVVFDGWCGACYCSSGGAMERALRSCLQIGELAQPTNHLCPLCRG
jgi:hypothetical protein